jgi:hypothetical protein
MLRWLGWFPGLRHDQGSPTENHDRIRFDVACSVRAPSQILKSDCNVHLLFECNYLEWKRLPSACLCALRWRQLPSRRTAMLTMTMTGSFRVTIEVPH